MKEWKPDNIEKLLESKRKTMIDAHQSKCGAERNTEVNRRDGQKCKVFKIAKRIFKTNLTICSWCVGSKV